MRTKILELQTNGYCTICSSFCQGIARTDENGVQEVEKLPIPLQSFERVSRYLELDLNKVVGVKKGNIGKWELRGALCGTCTEIFERHSELITKLEETERDLLTNTKLLKNVLEKSQNDTAKEICQKGMQSSAASVLAYETVERLRIETLEKSSLTIVKMALRYDSHEMDAARNVSSTQCGSSGSRLANNVKAEMQIPPVVNEMEVDDHVLEQQSQITAPQSQFISSIQQQVEETSSPPLSTFSGQAVDMTSARETGFEIISPLHIWNGFGPIPPHLSGINIIPAPATETAVDAGESQLRELQQRSNVREIIQVQIPHHEGSSVDDIISHTFRANGDDRAGGTFICPYCDRAFRQNAHLKGHIAQVHLPQDQKTFCQLCNKSYVRFKEHKTKYHRERNFQCEFCHRCYIFDGALQNHKKHCTRGRIANLNVI